LNTVGLRLRFLGAARNVTGSRYLLEAGSRRVLVDCGLYQEREFAGRNWDPFPVPPASLDAVLLTHAHLDHCGYLPRLVRDGFRGRVFGTRPTAEIAEIVLRDSASLQAEDAANKRKRHEKEGRRGPYPEEPLYQAQDVDRCCALFEPVDLERAVTAAPGIEAVFHEVGHILGAAMIRVTVRDGGATRTVLFSGDIGRWDRPLIRDPQPCPASDYVVMESTYGDREHEDVGAIPDLLAEAVRSTRERGGNLLIPSFAIERSQDVLYFLHELRQSGRVPFLLVFVDSPMAVRVADVFMKHREFLDEDMQAWLSRGQSPFHFSGLHMARTVEESKAINNVKGTVVVLAGSGMCTGGRIKHHLVRNLARPESTVLFVGYQARGTLGRQILDGAPEVRVLGQRQPVRARVLQIHGFSAHADRSELLRWAQPLASRPPRRLFVTHGEPEVAAGFADTLRARWTLATSVPAYGDQVELE